MTFTNLKDILPRYLNKNNLYTETLGEKVKIVINNVLKDFFKENASAIKYENGKLTIKVDNSMVASDLKFKESEMISILNNNSLEISKIYYRK